MLIVFVHNTDLYAGLFNNHRCMVGIEGNKMVPLNEGTFAFNNQCISLLTNGMGVPLSGNE